MEHKVKEENFRLGETRSKSDQNIKLPQLYERKQKKGKANLKDKRNKIGSETGNLQRKKGVGSRDGEAFSCYLLIIFVTHFICRGNNCSKQSN